MERKWSGSSRNLSMHPTEQNKYTVPSCSHAAAADPSSTVIPQTGSTIGTVLPSVVCRSLYPTPPPVTALDRSGRPEETRHERRVASAYDVLKWRHPVTGEPGHTFILVDETGRVEWIKDYGAEEHGSIMYVVPKEFVRELTPHL